MCGVGLERSIALNTRAMARGQYDDSGGPNAYSTKFFRGPSSRPVRYARPSSKPWRGRDTLTELVATGRVEVTARAGRAGRHEQSSAAIATAIPQPREGKSA